jgi:hypothetical protein
MSKMGSILGCILYVVFFVFTEALFQESFLAFLIPAQG